MKPPKFLYFDLGKVLLDFSVERMVRQLAEVAGADRDRVAAVVFDEGLQERYESGLISNREFYETFCERTGLDGGSRPDADALLEAGSDIFEINVPMIPVVAQLREAGYRMGILSNTCDCHWEFCLRRYRLLSESFSVHALSFRIHAAKPSAAIFRAAAKLADVDPRDVFFVDDIAGHVAGAKAAGFDAVQYTSTRELVAELWKRAIRFNY